jgi:hypothetical protein
MKRIALYGLPTGVLAVIAFSMSGCGCKSGGTNACTAVGAALQASQPSQQSATRQKDSSVKSKVEGGRNGQ